MIATKMIKGSKGGFVEGAGPSPLVVEEGREFVLDRFCLHKGSLAGGTEESSSTASQRQEGDNFHDVGDTQAHSSPKPSLRLLLDQPWILCIFAQWTLSAGLTRNILTAAYVSFFGQMLPAPKAASSWPDQCTPRTPDT